MKRIAAILLVIIAVTGILVVNLYGMNIESAFEKTVPVEYIELYYPGATRRYPDEPTKTDMRVSIEYEEDLEFIIEWQVFPANATYRNLGFAIQGGGETEDGQPIVEIDRMGRVSVKEPTLMFTISAETLEGKKIYTTMRVMLSGILF